MYGSYGSYSSLGGSSYISSAPMDITPTTLRTHDHDASCAFPSWPRRSSLSESDREERPTSYLSDDDLFLSDPFSDDDSQSVSSASSTCASPPTTALTGPAVQLTEAEVLEMERERVALQRDFVRNLLCNERERRRQQAATKKQQQQRRSSPKKSPKNSSKLHSMTPIAE